jgi:hypothetical protein
MSHRQRRRTPKIPWAWRMPARWLLAVVALVALSACGGGGTPTQASSPTPAVQPSPGPSSPPGAAGTIAAITGSQLEVQNPRIGQVTVSLTSKTTLTETVKGTASDLAAGDCVVVSGNASAGTSPSGGPFTASTIRITSTTGTCTGLGGPFGEGGPGGGGPGGGGGTFPRPSGTPFPRPSGSFAPRAFGTIASISGSTLVVHGTDRTGSTTSTTVTLTGTTTVTKIVTASRKDLAVGKCVSAIGPADQTGAITATSIEVSSPGASGCSFGGFGGFGGPGGAGFPGQFSPGAPGAGNG